MKELRSNQRREYSIIIRVGSGTRNRVVWGWLRHLLAVRLILISVSGPHFKVGIINCAHFGASSQDPLG